MGITNDHRHLLKSICVFSALVFTALLIFSAPAHADTHYWISGDENWSAGSKWVTGVPEFGDTAYLNTYGTIAYTETNPAFRELHILASTGNSMVLNHSSGTLTLAVDPNAIDDQGKTYTAPSYLYVNATGDNGAGTLSYAAYNLSGTGVLVKGPGEVKIGTDGTGYFIQSGSSSFQFTGALYLGDTATGHGVYTMTGGSINGWYGTLSVQNENGVYEDVTQTWYGGIVLGEWGGTGEFLQSGGSVTIDNLSLARQAGATGIYELSGTGVLNVNDIEFIGELGTGTFTQTDGLNTTNRMSLGGSQLQVIVETIDGVNYYSTKLVQGNGTYTLNPETMPGGGVNDLTVNGNLTVGDSGIGTFNHTNGRVSVGGELVLGTNTTHEVWIDPDDTGPLSAYVLDTQTAHGSGIYVLYDGEVHVYGEEAIGANADSDGQFHQAIYGDFDNNGTQEWSNGGTHTVDGALYLGRDTDSIGTYWLHRGTLNVGDVAFIGNYGRGTFNQDGGMIEVTNDLNLGQNKGSTGNYDLSEIGVVNIGRNLYVGLDGNGTFTQSAKTSQVNVTEGVLIASSSQNANNGVGTYNLQGGDLNSIYMTVGGSGQGTFTQTGGTNTTGDLIIGGNGTGTYNLSGGTLNADTVIVEINSTFNFTGGDTGGSLYTDAFNNYGEFIGAGTINPYTSELTFNNYGTLAPGNSPGSLTINGDYTQDSTGTLEIELLNNSSAGSTYDQLLVDGTATLGGTIRLSLLTGFDIDDGETFNIMYYDTYSGDFANWIGLNPGSALSFSYEYGEHYLTLTAHEGTSTVPIPGTLLMLGTGLLGLVGIRRRMAAR